MLKLAIIVFLNFQCKPEFFIYIIIYKNYSTYQTASTVKHTIISLFKGDVITLGMTHQCVIHNIVLYSTYRIMSSRDRKVSFDGTPRYPIDWRTSIVSSSQSSVLSSPSSLQLFN